MYYGDLLTAQIDIVATGQKLLAEKLLAGSWGNLSVRIDDKRIAISPSGRGYDTLAPADIVVVDLNGKVVAGDLLPSSELPLHLAIYNNIKECGAIVHTHSIYASACAVARVAVPPIIEDLVQIIGGSVACAEYALPGTDLLANNVLTAMGSKRAVLMANHGVVTWGATLKEALMIAELTEKAAQIYYISKGLGGPVLLSDEDVELMHRFYTEHYSKRQRGEE